MPFRYTILFRSIQLILLARASSVSSYCSSGDGDGTSVGKSVSKTYGKIVVIGDSLLDGNGSTEGMVEETLSELLGDTEVANNAIGGFGLDDIADSVACSCFSSCKWSVVGGGINDMEDKSSKKIVREMKALVQRELASAGNEGVIIQGYVPDCDVYASGPTFNGIMDAYRDFAASTNNVWFVDPRAIEPPMVPGHKLMGQPCKDTKNKYRIEEDNSHPTPLSGKVMATAIANIIKEQTGGNDDPIVEEEDLSNDDENDGPGDESNDENDDEDDENEESGDESNDQDSSNDEDEGSNDEDSSNDQNDGSGDDEEEDDEDASNDEDSSNDQNDGSGDDEEDDDEDASNDEDSSNDQNDGSGDEEEDDEDASNDEDEGSNDEDSSNDQNDGSGDDEDDDDEDEDDVCEDAKKFPWKGKKKNCKNFVAKKIKKQGKRKACKKFGDFCPNMCDKC